MNSSLTAKRRFGKWRWWIFGILGALALAIGILRLIPQPAADARLAGLRSEGYPTSLAELAASVSNVPEADNISGAVMAATSVLRQAQNKKTPLVNGSVVEVERGKPWSQEMLLASREFMAANTQAFSQIPAIVKLRHGDNHLNYSTGSQIIVLHLSQYKSLIQALAAKAGLAAEENRPRDAVQDILGMVAVARGLDDEPLAISQLVRIGLEAITCRAVERLVNRVTVSEIDLAELQAALEASERPTRLARALAGELCLGLDMFGQKPSQLAAAASMGAPNSGPSSETLAFALYTAAGLLNVDRAAYIRVMADFIDIARMNPWERREPLAKWKRDISELRSHWYRMRVLTGMLAPSLANIPTLDAGVLAQVRCAATGLAVERYRHQHNGNPPALLSDLVPALLSGIPADPVDGRPLRYERRGQGYVVYSLGPDGDDDHGRERVRTQGNDDYDTTFVMEK